MFADDMSIFSTVFDVRRSSITLNNGLSDVKYWAFQWKMDFNPDPNNQATEVVFSHKRNPVNHPALFFSRCNGSISKTSWFNSR